VSLVRTNFEVLSPQRVPRSGSGAAAWPRACHSCVVPAGASWI